MANEKANGQDRYDALLELAGGDTDLVQKAILMLGTDDEPQFDDVAAVIEQLQSAEPPATMRLDEIG